MEFHVSKRYKVRNALRERRILFGDTEYNKRVFEKNIRNKSKRSKARTVESQKIYGRGRSIRGSIFQLWMSEYHC